MAGEYDLIQHPFYIDEPNNINFKSRNNKYYYFFDCNCLSPKIESTEKVIAHNYYYLIEIDDETDSSQNVEIVYCFEKMHVFEKFCDFILPLETKALGYYENFDKVITKEDFDVFDGEDELRIKQQILNEDIPVVTPDIISSVYQISTKKNKNQQISADTKVNWDGNSVCIKIRDNIPEECPRDIHNGIISLFSKTITSRLFQDLETLSNAYIVVNSSKLPEIIQELSLKSNKYIIRRSLGLCYYYYVSGPFAKNWVRFGTDLRKSQDNYIYQCVSSKNNKVRVYLKNNTSIIKEVEKNRNWYLLKEFDDKLGWVSVALRKYIYYLIDTDKDALLKNDEDVESSSGDEFELFD